MTNTIKIRRSATASAVPTTSQLQLGELAINTYDGKLFLKKSVSGVETVVEVGAGGGLPQALGTTDSPTFDKLYLGNNGNGTNLKVGDDVWLGDVNTANTLGIRGVQDSSNGYIAFGSDTSTLLGRAGSGALTWGGNTVYHAGNISSALTNYLTLSGGTLTGGLTFNGTGIKIQGDFSNATLASRLMFQTSTTNGATSIFAIPNGTNDTAAWTVFNTADPANAGLAQLRITSGEAAIAVGKNGTGTYLPFKIYTNNTAQLALDTSGYLTLGTAPSSNSSHLNLGGYNQVGGVGYHGFLAVTNTYSSATTPSKFFRLNSAGGIEILNNAYSAIIFGLSDAGALTGVTMNANVITAGTIATARLGSGTADSTTYLRGDGTWATVAGGGLTLSDDTSTAATYYPIFATATSGSQSSAKVSSTKLTFNPSTGVLSATQVTGSSDEKFKTNWRALPKNYIELLANVKYGIYDRTDCDTPVTQAGVSAQSMRWALEHVVVPDGNGDLSVAYGNAALVSAIALAERVIELERRLSALEATAKGA